MHWEQVDFGDPLLDIEANLERGLKSKQSAICNRTVKKMKRLILWLRFLRIGKGG